MQLTDRQPDSSESIISISNVNKIYSTRDENSVQALTSIDLDIAKGEFVALVGPSGCGKTTLLRALAGLLQPSSGEIRVNGQMLTAPSDDVGIVFQSAVLFPWLTILENVLVPARLKHVDPKASRTHATELLEMVGLEAFGDKYPHELSGGMQQRAAICRALIRRPPIILMDEPFGALDAFTREHLNMELLRIWAKEGSTIVFVTHSIQEAVLLADRVVVMSPRPGRIVAEIRPNLPRPRTLDQLHLEEFGDAAMRIRNLLGSQSSL